MIKKFKILSVTFIIILFVLLNCSVYAIEGNAASLYGEQAEQHATSARDAYVRAGYTCTLITKPSSTVTRSNLVAASVAQFAGHANKFCVNLANSGVTSNSSYYPDYVNVSYMNFNNYNTKLFTYLGCNTAGYDNELSSDSIAAVTANRGVQVVVGFTDEYNIASGKSWCKRYNDNLAAGYGVSDAILEANDHIYLIPNVKSAGIWHHGNPNLTITLNSTYSTNSNSNVNIANDKNILQKPNSITSNIDNIIKCISNYYPNFDINNYEVVHNTTSMVNVDTDEITEIEYIDFMLKIGDFITTAGFTVKSMDNKIVQILDNNINISKQEEALEHSELFVANESKSSLNRMKNLAISKMKANYSNTLIEDNVEYKYYYDIETNKKYIVYEVPSVINISQSEKCVLYDAIQIEIQ